MQVIDVIAYLVAALGVCLALAAAGDPRVAEWLASVLVARAEAVKVARKTYRFCRRRRLALEEEGE